MTTEKCINCNGLGWVGVGTNRVPCPSCDTTGVVPSLGPLPVRSITIDVDNFVLAEANRMAEEVLRLRIESAATQAAFRQLIDRAQKAETECDAMRAELDTLKAAQPSGWMRIGDWAWGHPDGRMVRTGYDTWIAQTCILAYQGKTPEDAALVANWHDFPGVTGLEADPKSEGGEP